MSGGLVLSHARSQQSCGIVSHSQRASGLRDGAGPRGPRRGDAAVAVAAAALALPVHSMAPWSWHRPAAGWAEV